VISHLALLPDRRAMRRIDVTVLLFVAVCGALGLIAGRQLWELARLGASLLAAAQAIEETGRGVALLSRVPVVGSGAEQLSQSIAAAAVSLRSTGVGTSGAIETLAVVVGLAVGLVPLLAVAAGYLPLRLARIRQIRALRRLVRGRPDALVVEHLARQAATRLPLGDLRRVSRSPWQDLADGRHHRLAAAELRRLGLVAPPDWLGGPDGR
jgi:hypothetical protein